MCRECRLFYTFTPDTAPALAAFRVRLWELPAFVGVGALLGAVSALFVAINVNLVCGARQRWIPTSSRIRPALLLMIVYIVSGRVHHLGADTE